jgi:hypothetical protein
MCQPAKNPTDRQYRRRCQQATSLCLIAFLACFHLFRPATGPLALFFSGLAGAFYFGIFISTGLLVMRKFDEFQRILLTQSFIWATVVTMSIITIWGFVELGSHNTVPRLPIVFLPILLLCITAAAKLLIFRQHRSPVE